MGFDLGGLLSRFTQGGAPAATADTPDHFEQVAQAAPPDLLQQGLSAMFHSDQTPPFGQMAGQLFGHANPTQQAGMLNQLIASMGPAVLSSLAAGAGSGVLGGLLGRLGQGGAPAAGQPPTVTPEQASQVTPEQVQQMADHAQQHSPGIVEQMSGFYAQHPTLVKSLGGSALAIALSRMAQQHAA